MRARIVTGVLAIVIVVGGGGGVAVADDASPPLVAEPAAPTLDDGTAEVALRNDTAVELDVSDRRVEVELEEGSTEAADAADQDAGLPDVTGPGQVPPGGAVTLTVDLGTDIALASDPVLVVVVPPGDGVGAEGYVLRVTLSRHEAVTPEVSTWSVTRALGGANRGTRLPLTGPCGDLDLDGSPVGVLQAGGTTMQIRARCDRPEDEHATLSWQGPGYHVAGYDTFAGTITVGSGDDAEVTVKGTSTTGIVPFLILLGFGIALAVLAGAWRGGSRDQRQMEVEALRAAWVVSPRNAKNVDAQFRAAAIERGIEGPITTWSIRAAVEEGIEGVLTQLDQDRAAGDADALKTARASLAAIVTRAKGWPEAANRLGDLADQLQTLMLMSDYCDVVLPLTLDLEPEGGRLTTAQIDTLQTTAAEAGKLVGRLELTRITAATSWAETHPEDARALAFMAALERLATEADPGRLGTVITTLEDARSVIAAEQGPDLLTLDHLVPVGGDGSGTADAPAPHATFDDPLEDAHRIAREMRWLDGLVFGALVLAACIGAIATLWDGKALGGWIDWSSVLAWGLGSTLVSGALATALSDLRRSDGLAKSLGLLR